MQRLVFSMISGALFGAGLLVSGMLDSVKVQAWLDVFGAWDPTLAFVMGGAMLPMIVAWRVAGRRERALLGHVFPAPVTPRFDVGFILGSVFFGMGWALVGLCPGPALASISFGGSGGLVFLFAMLAAMVAAPKFRIALHRISA